MNRKCLHRVCILMLLVLSAADGYSEEYYKEVRKSIQVNKDVQFKMEIDFADVDIQTWDQNVMEVIVKMDVSAKDQERAERMFECFTVEIREGMDQVAITIAAGNYNCDNKGKNAESYSVRVEIKMPREAKVDGNCAFGNVNIGDMMGACKLNVEYGETKINGLWSYDNDLHFAFGDGAINGTNGGAFENEYGGLKIGVLQGKATVHSSFGDLDIDRVSKECRDLEVMIEYGDADVRITPEPGFKFEARSSYGDIDLPSMAKKTFSEEDYSEKSVKGTIGSGEGKLILECDFGDVDVEISSN